jgi:hypothetical protein
MGFPTLGVPNDPFYFRIFHCKATSYWGTTIDGNPHKNILNIVNWAFNAGWQKILFLSSDLGLRTYEPWMENYKKKTDFKQNEGEMRNATTTL